jgi:hypothetical protein
VKIHCNATLLLCFNHIAKPMSWSNILQQNEKERQADVHQFFLPKLAEDRSYFYFTNKHPFLLGCSQRNVENSPPYVQYTVNYLQHASKYTVYTVQVYILVHTLWKHQRKHISIDDNLKTFESSINVPFVRFLHNFCTYWRLPPFLFVSRVWLFVEL